MLLLLLACSSQEDKPATDDTAVGVDSAGPDDTGAPDTDPDTDSGIDTDTGPVDDTGCAAAYFTDADGDGWGDAYAGSACTPPAGTASVDGDCADDDAARNPGAVEVCDTVDQDCDGEVDEGTTAILYVDGDGDGYGLTEVTACPAAGLVAIAGDCDDADLAVWPGAAEVCEDGVDQDCSGADDRCFAGGDFDVEVDSEVTWTGNDDWFGYGLSTLGDFDGDGIDDLVVESSQSSMASGGGGSGRNAQVSVIYGASFGTGSISGSSLPRKDPDTARYDMELRGDFDGDGYADLVWTGTDEAGTSSAQFTWGSATRWTTGGTASGDVQVTAPGYDYMGTDLAVGDADGDGLDDLLAARNTGAFLVYGDATRMGDTSLADHPSMVGSGWFGNGGVALGDLDGDGLDDTVITDVYADMSGWDAPSALYILYSSGRLTADLSLPGDEDAVVRGPAAMGLVYMGQALTAGDLDADGYDEIVAGSVSYDSAKGKVWVFGGGATRRSGDYDADTDAVASVYGATTSYVGVSVDVTDDLDGDGRNELFVGATNTGPLLFLGRDLVGSLTDADFSIRMGSAPADSRIGYQVASGDLDGDGLTDLLTSGYNAYGSGDGALWMKAGSGL